jgi:hypothetical protein
MVLPQGIITHRETCLERQIAAALQDRVELGRTVKELSGNLKVSNDEVVRLRERCDRLITELEKMRQEKSC